jgi:hypothetical protein
MNSKNAMTGNGTKEEFRDVPVDASFASTRKGPGVGRRSFLGSAVLGLIATQVPRSLLAADPTMPQAGGPNQTSLDFSRSYMYCAPTKTGIWVRIRIECFCRLVDAATGNADEFALGVVAKTGLGMNPKTGKRDPGYDYWLIFSKDKVYTRRTHATVYCRNPTTLEIKEFGDAGWHLEPVSSTQLQTAADVKKALVSGRQIVAKTEFRSSDGARSYIIEYPVKWADCGTQRESYRVETGPVVLLDPDSMTIGKPPAIEDFQWAYFDFHSSDEVRCLLDRPTPILSEATFFPPNEDKREARQNPSLTKEQELAIENRLFQGWDMPLSPEAMRELFSTDHYSDAADRKAINSLYSID